MLQLGLTDKTPLGRRQFALAFCGLAMVVVLTISSLQGPMAWPGGVLIAACLLVAVRFLRESNLPLYLRDAIPIVDVWEIVPGEGIGPLRLGPLDYDAVRLLRKSVVMVQQGSDRDMPAAACGWVDRGGGADPARRRPMSAHRIRWGLSRSNAS